MDLLKSFSYFVLIILLLALSPACKPKPSNETSMEETQALNDQCLSCHHKFSSEDITVAHAGAGIGCVDCHGKSKDHDFPPDILYSVGQVNSYCNKCHEEDKMVIPAHDTLAHVRKQNICTFCHGQHRL
jgi:hypothetical protein